MMMNWLRAQSISNCRRVLLKVQHNNLTPTPIRSIQHPTAPHIVGVKRPERPKFFDEDGSLHYEIAVPEDHDFLLEWELVHAFYPRFAPIPTIGELKREEAIDFCSSSVKRGVNSGCSILGFDGNELVVMCLNSVVKMPDNGYTPLSDKDFPYNKLKQDYQAEIDAGPYKSPKANAIAALLEALAKDIHLAFPPGVKVIDVGRPNVVHKDHRRHGYALEALLLSVKMGRDLLDCYGTMSRMAVGKSTPLGQKLKDAEPEAAKIFRLIRFPQFLAGGKPVFQDSTEAFFIFGAYKDIKNIV